MSNAKQPRSQQATVEKEMLQTGDTIQEIRIKLLQLAHAHGRPATQSIEIAASFEEYVLAGKSKDPANTAG